MLVLTRKVGEQINIGGDIVITLLEIGKMNVRLGIQAPKAVSVYRQEVYERITEENVRSAGAADEDLTRAADIWRKLTTKE